MRRDGEYINRAKQENSISSSLYDVIVCEYHIRIEHCVCILAINGVAAIKD